VSHPAGTLARMVLVAPPLPRAAATAEPVSEGGPAHEVLALLRGDSANRPRFDHTLAGGLRAWLEDAAYDVVAARGEHAPPLVLGPRRLLGATGQPAPPEEEQGSGDLSDRAVVSGLVHALFRQVVHTGGLDDPLADALEGLRATGPHPVVRHVDALSDAARAALSDEVSSHAGALLRLVPRFAPGWMPRTDDHVAIPLAGGRVVLRGAFDLLVGTPRPEVATLCALGLATGGPWVHERRGLHYVALLETLRSGAPPFRLALIETGSGRYGVEDVREEHLRAIASHIAAWLAREAAGA
jgi:hypothetical protein